MRRVQENKISWDRRQEEPRQNRRTMKSFSFARAFNRTMRNEAHTRRCRGRVNMSCRTLVFTTHVQLNYSRAFV